MGGQFITYGSSTLHGWEVTKADSYHMVKQQATYSSSRPQWMGGYSTVLPTARRQSNKNRRGRGDGRLAFEPKSPLESTAPRRIGTRQD